MSDPAAGLLVAARAALEASAALATAMGGGTPKVLTGLPQNETLPYVVIGEDQILGDDDACIGASEAILEVHVWARPEPPAADAAAAQARAMGGAIRAALTAALDVDGQDVDEFQFEAARYGTDPDGSAHGILTFRYLLTEQA